MYLPDAVLACIDALEKSGHATYAVGGCVRDAYLGIEPHDYDLCTAATSDETAAVFASHRLVTAGKKHGTIGVVTEMGVVEITTFRTEGGYLDNRHPDYVNFVTDIREDLSRRDYTIGAMAYSPYRGYADPFGGREDLNNRILRAVGDPAARFQEDSLRILRGVRFAVRFGLTPEEKTLEAMFDQKELMDNLARERVFDELCKLLPLVTAEDLLRFAPVQGAVITELIATFGFDQHSPHHAYDLFTHIAHVVEGVPAELSLRWAALLHDLGKIPTFTRDQNGRGHFYGHADVGAEMADAVLRRLKAPTALREQVVTLIKLHMTKLEPDKRLLRRRLGKLGWDTLEQLLILQEADMGSKGTGNPEEMEQFSTIRACLADIRQEDNCLSIRDLAVNGHDLMALGLSGPAIGKALEQLLEQVQDDRLSNEKTALLDSVRANHSFPRGEAVTEGD